MSKLQKTDTIFCKEDEYKTIEFLGQGNFGKVESIDDNNVIKTSDLFEYESKYKYTTFIDSNLKEALFLTQYNHPMITQLKCLQIKDISEENFKTELILHIKNAGKILSNTNNIDYILYQLLYLLSQFEDLNIIHTDIKPDNILVDDEYKITLIDYGTIILEPEYIKFNNAGTIHFEAPESTEDSVFNYNGPKNIITTKLDIFSLGTSIYSLYDNKYIEKISNIFMLTNFLTKLENSVYDIGGIDQSVYYNNIKSLEEKEIILKVLNIQKLSETDTIKVIEKISELKQKIFDFSLIKNQNIKLLIENMTNFDYTKRKSASVLLKSSIFDKFNYQKIEIYSDLEKKDIIIDNNINKNTYFTIYNMIDIPIKYKNRKNIIEFIFKICYKLKMMEFFVLSVKIVDILFSTLEIKKDDMETYIYVCINLAHIMILNYYLIFDDYNYGFLGEQIDLYNKTIEILKILNFVAYEKTFDKFIQNPDYEKIKLILKDEKNIVSDNDKYIQIYNSLK